MIDLLQLSCGSNETTQVGLHVNSAFFMFFEIVLEE